MRNQSKSLIFVLCFFYFSILYSQQFDNFGEKKLDSIIKLCIRKIDREESISNMKWAVNIMERVTKINNSWSSNYYSSYFNLIAAMETKEEEKKNRYYNSFIKSYNVAEDLSKTDKQKSELLTLKAFLNIDLLTNDPLKHGRELSGTIAKLFEDALKLNPENPRAIYLDALFKIGMSNFFNNKEDFCDRFLFANKQFVKELMFSDDYLMPLWGADHNSSLLLKCYDTNE